LWNQSRKRTQPIDFQCESAYSSAPLTQFTTDI
jgi:hypothetical protein